MQVRVADLKSLMTGNDQFVSVSVRLVLDLSIFDLWDAAICNCVRVWISLGI